MEDRTPFKTISKLFTIYNPQREALQRGQDPYPVSIEVNLSGSCNQGCNWCINENSLNRNTMLDLDNPKIYNFFLDFKKMGGNVLAWSGGGEPTLHPKFEKGLYIVKSAGLRQGIYTNGDFSDKIIDAIAKSCDWIRISIDTNCKKEYAIKRNTLPSSFDRVLNNARLLADKEIKVGFNMNVAKWNIDQIYDLYNLACKLNIDYLQVRPTLPTPFNHKKNESLLSKNYILIILDNL